MTTQFPLEYKLENGTHVTVTDTGTGRYDFQMHDENGDSRNFTYVDGEHTKAEWDELLDYQQLEALRKFWLEMEEIK